MKRNNVDLKDGKHYVITAEWTREDRIFTTDRLDAEQAGYVIDLCNQNPIQIISVKEVA